MAGSDYLKFRIAEQIRVLVSASDDAFDSRFQLARSPLQDALRSVYKNQDLRGFRDIYKEGDVPIQKVNCNDILRVLPSQQGDLPAHQWRLIQNLRQEVEELRDFAHLTPDRKDALAKADREIRHTETPVSRKTELRHFIHADGSTISAEGLVGYPREVRRTGIAVEHAGASQASQQNGHSYNGQSNEGRISRLDSAQAPHTHRPGRVPGLAGAATTAGAAAVGVLITGGNTAQAAQASAEAAASNIPGIGGRLARNRHEAAIRDAADAFGLAISAAGAWIGGVGGSVIPAAGNAVGAVGGGIIGNLIGTMGAEEVLRLYARYVDGHVDDVEPSSGERLVIAAMQTGRLSIERLKPYLERAAQSVREHQSTRTKTFNPSSDVVTRGISVEEEQPNWIPQDFIKQMEEMESRPPALEARTTLPITAPGLVENLAIQAPTSIADSLSPYTLNFNLGPIRMDKYVGQLREGQTLPNDLMFAIDANGRQFLELVEKTSGTIDVRNTQEFAPFFNAEEPITSSRMGAILFALSLKPDASGNLQFDNQLRLRELPSILVSSDLDQRVAIARNIERGIFSEGQQIVTPSTPQLQTSHETDPSIDLKALSLPKSNLSTSHRIP